MVEKFAPAKTPLLGVPSRAPLGDEDDEVVDWSTKSWSPVGCFSNAGFFLSAVASLPCCCCSRTKDEPCLWDAVGGLSNGAPPW